MNLAYVSAAELSIKATLDEGETLGNLVGPVDAFIPTDPTNVDYAAILEQDLYIHPYTDPDPPDGVEAPPSIEDLHEQVQDQEARLTVLEQASRR